ncbi:MAG TPA: argininosuccinate synthase [Candidatus Saccharimonadales bacterium]
METTTTYKKIASYEAKKGEFDTCLLLYSGGLDTSVMLKWIQEEYECDVITLTFDIGQTVDDLEAIKQKALSLGAKDAIICDAKKEFADNILAQAIKANADYQGGYALSTCLGRVIISEIAVKVAHEKGCQVIAHGCTGKGNDQVRFDTYITTLDANLKIVAPVREWGMGRAEEIAYAEARGIPVKQSAAKPYSYDENMWGNACEGGELEQVEKTANLKDMLLWCNVLEETPDEKATVTISFEAGVPTALNGTPMPLHEIIASMNKLGAEHGVGVFQTIEDRLIGFKVREVYENPGATILIAAHKKLEYLVSTRQENEMKPFMDQKWAYMTYAAQWHEPTMHHIHAYINDQNQKVTGDVTVELFKGNVTVVALDSPYSLFDHDLMTSMTKDTIFNQNASTGFIELHSLAQKTANKTYKYKETNCGS